MGSVNGFESRSGTGVCGRAADWCGPDHGPLYTDHAVLAVVAGRPDRSDGSVAGLSDREWIERVHRYNESVDCVGATGAISTLDGGTDHASGNDKLFSDRNLRVDAGRDMHDEQRGYHGQHDDYDGDTLGVSASGSEQRDWLRDDVCQCGSHADAISVGRNVRTGVVIREATLEDVPTLVAMGRQFAQSATYRDVVRDNPEQMTVMAQTLITSDVGIMLVLERDGQLNGMIGMICMPHFLSGDVFAGEICWWVNPGHRGDGLHLMKAAEAWAQARGAKTIQMIAPNDRVGRLYERMGYRRTETTYQKACVAC